DDRLAVHSQVEAEDAVRARVLRAHADDKLVGAELLNINSAREQRLALGVRAAGEAGPVGEALGYFQIRAERIDLLGAEMLAEPFVNPARKDLGGRLVVRLEEVLAEWIVGIAFPHENPLQLGVAGEANAHHVEDLSLLEIGAAINVVERRDFALAFRLGRPHTQLDQAARLEGAVKLVIDFDAVLVVDALQTGEVVVLDRVLVAQVKGDRDQLLRRDQQARLDNRDGSRTEFGIESRGQLFEALVSQPDQAGTGQGALGLL